MYTGRELLARMIKCEAGGEGLGGMQAVATTIMNRVRVPQGEYLRTGQGDITKVLSQPGQFTCYVRTINGTPNNQNIYNSHPEQVHYDVADWAMAGNIHPGVVNTLWYMNPFKPKCPPHFPYNKSGKYFNTIVQHCFFEPTARYATT